MGNPGCKLDVVVGMNEGAKLGLTVGALGLDEAIVDGDNVGAAEEGSLEGVEVGAMTGTREGTKLGATGLIV